MRINQNFLGRGGGVHNNTSSVGVVWIFSETAHWPPIMHSKFCLLLLSIFFYSTCNLSQFRHKNVKNCNCLFQMHMFEIV